MSEEDALARIMADPRYKKNLAWGKPRQGHPEGSVEGHIRELESNLQRLRSCSWQETLKLRLLIHAHDTFKAESKRDVAITDPKSHASLARGFLAEFVADPDLLAMVQWHDEPYAIWRSRSESSKSQRLNRLFDNVVNWDLFCAFLIVDGCTRGKDAKSTRWIVEEAFRRGRTRFTAADLL